MYAAAGSQPIAMRRHGGSRTLMLRRSASARRDVRGSCAGAAGKPPTISATSERLLASVMRTSSMQPVRSRPFGASTCTISWRSLRPVKRDEPRSDLARALDQHARARADQAAADGAAARGRRPRTGASRRALFSSSLHVVVELERGRVRARRILEAERGDEADLFDQRQRVSELGLGLAGKADDDVGREREARRAPCSARARAMYSRRS